MSKITRYNGNLKAFASEATGNERTIFGDTAQSDTLDANITLDLLRGWGVIGVDSNPTKQHFNGLAFTLGQLIAYLHQQGVPEWNVAQEYYAGSVVTTPVGIYRLKSGGVGSSDPDTDGGVNWELIPTQAKVDAKAAISGQAFSGNISAPNLSGTNTGDQTLNEIGVGQTWQDVSGSRSDGVTYTNSTGKPIFVSVTSTDAPGNNTGLTLFVNGSIIAETLSNASVTPRSNITAIIPNGSTYEVAIHESDNLERWWELR
jgi:hypothetical protein